MSAAALGSRGLLALFNVDINLGYIVIIAFVAGFSLAWAIGANDVANTFGTSVGAKVLTIKQAIFCAAIFEFLGAFLMGSQVSDTLRDGIIIPEQYEDNPSQLAVGMTSAMIGACFLISLATKFHLPVSGTHSVIGAVMGFAIIAQGIDGVIWEEIGLIILSWVISPVIAGSIAITMFGTVRYFILRAENSFERGLYFMPICYWFTLAINVFFIVYKGSGGGFVDLSVIPAWGVFLISVGTGYLAGFIVFLSLPILRRKAIAKTEHLKLVQEEEEEKVVDVEGTDVEEDITPKPKVEVFDLQTEQLFSFLQILTACFGSFAHGANDVANAIGPFAVVISVYMSGTVDQDSPIPWWVLAGGGVGIIIGLATWGHKVMATIGENLCKVTPSRGFNIELASAVTVLTGSKLGLPLSTTHCQVGGVVGVGLADGRKAVNWWLVLQVFGGWVVTLPIAAVVSGFVYLILWNLFLYYIPATKFFDSW